MTQKFSAEGRCLPKSHVIQWNIYLEACSSFCTQLWEYPDLYAGSSAEGQPILEHPQPNKKNPKRKLIVKVLFEIWSKHYIFLLSLFTKNNKYLFGFYRRLGKYKNMNLLRINLGD